MISVGERHWLLLEKCPGFKSAILLENSVAKVNVFYHVEFCQNDKSDKDGSH